MNLNSKSERFYDLVTVVPEGDVFAVALDDRKIKTPAGSAFVSPTRGLAEAIADEWRDQEEKISPASMPLTGLLNTAIDRVGPERETLASVILQYVHSDLLCYREKEGAELSQRQKNLWQPLLDWAADTLNAQMIVTSGVVPITQTDRTVAALANTIKSFDEFTFAAFSVACATTGSLIVGLALVVGRIGLDEAVEISLLEEIFQAEVWGEDREAVNRRKNIADELSAVCQFLELIHSRQRQAVRQH